MVLFPSSLVPSLHVLVFGKKTFLCLVLVVFYLFVCVKVYVAGRVGWCQCAWGSLFAEGHVGVRVLW